MFVRLRNGRQHGVGSLGWKGFVHGAPTQLRGRHGQLVGPGCMHFKVAALRIHHQQEIGKRVECRSQLPARIV